MLVVVAGSAVVAGVAGMLVPRLIRALPEPTPADDEVDAEPKTAYAEIGARPALWWRTAVASAVAAALVAWAVGPDFWLVVLVPLVPVCAALAVVDWHT